MSDRTCSMLWQAEAVEDGRLDASDAASFGRHAATCAECAGRARRLASLRRDLESVAPPEPDPLVLRRMRAAVLRGAGAGPARRWVPGARAWLGVALVVVVLGLVVRSELGGEGTSAATNFEVVNLAGAVVTSRVEAGLTRATLSAGEAAFHVEHVGPSRRFVLALPDGELEVRGTRFTVSVKEQHTERVAVTEGVVALRLDGQGERVLRAGDAWATPAPVASTPATPSPAAAPTAPIASGAGRPARRSRAASAHAASPSSSPSTPPPRSDRSDTGSLASARFAEAVSAFESARYAQADALLAAFERDFGGDARVEDASFMRAVARSRSGDAEGAAALARDYLERFPQGLRRREVTRLLGP